MLNGLLLGVIIPRGIFLWMILFFFVILGGFEQENLLQVSSNAQCVLEKFISTGDNHPKNTFHSTDGAMRSLKICRKGVRRNFQ